MTHICECGKTYEGRPTTYLCPDCRHERKIELQKVYHRRHSMEKRQAERERIRALKYGHAPAISIQEIVRSAEAAGMTYGKYVAQLEGAKLGTV